MTLVDMTNIPGTSVPTFTHFASSNAAKTPRDDTKYLVYVDFESRPSGSNFPETNLMIRPFNFQNTTPLTERGFQQIKEKQLLCCIEVKTEGVFFYSLARYVENVNKSLVLTIVHNQNETRLNVRSLVHLNEGSYPQLESLYSAYITIAQKAVEKCRSMEKKDETNPAVPAGTKTSAPKACVLF